MSFETSRQRHKPTQAEANQRFFTQTQRGSQHLMQTDENGQRLLTPTAAALYETTPEKSARCPHCLRAFDPRRSHGGRQRIWCTATCKNAMADDRRYQRSGDWFRCAECGVDGLRFDARRVLCAPAWPASYNDPSPCAAAHKRTLDARAAKAYRGRRLVALSGPAMAAA